MHATLYAIYGGRKDSIGYEFVTYLAGMDADDVQHRFKYICRDYEELRVAKVDPLNTGDELSGVISRVLLFWQKVSACHTSPNASWNYHSLSYITATIETIYFWSPMLHALQAMKK